MYTITTEQITNSLPEASVTYLPANWLASLSPDQPIFTALYQWLQNTTGKPDLQKVRNTTFIGKSLFKKLVQAERTRLRTHLGYRGDHLDENVAWVLLEYSSATSLGNCYFRDESILTISLSNLKKLKELVDDIFQQKRQQHISRIKAAAEGHNFYTWMIAQTDRPDEVGELARYMELDVFWPGRTDTFEEIKGYLSSQTPKGLFDRELSKAWLEYLQQYPKRSLDTGGVDSAQKQEKLSQGIQAKISSPHWQAV